ncbi:RecX-family regulatory protein [Legionella wadsworthii]|uniref:RecX-family regulatory protein n=1 Tax=Legionella wadsworthii TaxID=28088 RepID=A0A378LQK2_9GAMM|nr:regulatory protein RecX [Legionella wadsworthii]STY28630.1 RecX-family regulatory protein [Legionella wadsworthii]
MNMRNTSLVYLSEQFHSENTIRSFLESKFGNSKNILLQIEDVINQLKEERLIDDVRLANTLASHYRHKGNRFIMDLLRKKGIQDDIITQALSQLKSEVIRAMKEVKLRLAGKWDNSENQISYIHRFLQGRQFSHLTIRLVINELICHAVPGKEAA